MSIKKALWDFKEDERGIATVWVGVLVAIFSFSLIYGIMFDVLNFHIFTTVINNAPADMPQAFFNNITAFRALLYVLPFVFMFVIVLWAFIRSQKEQYV